MQGTTRLVVLQNRVTRGIPLQQLILSLETINYLKVYNL